MSIERCMHLWCAPACSSTPCSPPPLPQRPGGAAGPPLQEQEAPGCSRRSALHLAAQAALLAAAGGQRQALAADAAAAAAALPPAPGFVAFSNPGQGYALQRPEAWEKVDKAGADALFQDPQQRGNTAGVTVYPVTIATLAEFGGLAAVGEKLLAAGVRAPWALGKGLGKGRWAALGAGQRAASLGAALHAAASCLPGSLCPLRAPADRPLPLNAPAEREKESTLSVRMVAQAEGAAGAGGPPLYAYEYELESTRGRKRILSSVAIARRRLFILNATQACDKGSCAGAEGGLEVLRAVAGSFTVG